LILTVGTGCGLVTIQERPPTGIEEDANFGPPLNAIRIEGLGHTKESVVLRQLASKIGELYTVESAYQDNRNLDQLRIFSSVNFAVEPDGDGVILVLTLTEVNPYSPSVKVYITDENGVSLGLGGSSANFLGQALKATASVNAGGQTGVRLGLASPWRPGRTRQQGLPALSE
jgi:outer membrane protein assembly factor BamA